MLELMKRADALLDEVAELVVRGPINGVPMLGEETSADLAIVEEMTEPASVQAEGRGP